MDGISLLLPANGRGPVVPDGYGIAYQVNKNSLSFNITCLKDNPVKNFELNAERMQHYLREAGDHMREVFSTGQEIKAKL
jgi:carnitine O-acetyltransferase